MSLSRPPADPSREAGVDLGRRTLIVRRSRLAVRVNALFVCAMLTVCVLVLTMMSLATGDYPLSWAQVLSVLLGHEDGLARTVVVQWRAPRAAAAIVFGAALGVSGAIMQSLTRNPLAGPDVLGFSAGSYTGALLVILNVGSFTLGTALGAIIGGLVTAALVYLLSYQRGTQGFRLIIVGVGVSAMLGACNTWLILRADLDAAISAAAWGMGSLAGTGWTHTGIAALSLAVLFIGAAWLAPSLRVLELGDDSARALGARVDSSRLILLIISVALTAVATAVAGPIVFVALAAPQIGRRLARSSGISLPVSACTGAVLLIAADFIAQHALPTTLPVGIITIVVGGGYLVWLLIHEARVSR